jgi:hypothetical protein
MLFAALKTRMLRPSAFRLHEFRAEASKYRHRQRNFTERRAGKFAEKPYPCEE